MIERGMNPQSLQSHNPHLIKTLNGDYCLLAQDLGLLFSLLDWTAPFLQIHTKMRTKPFTLD
jgi:hypothetical protein